AGPGDRAALSGALGVPESDLRVCGGGLRALATAPEVAAARERAGQVAARLTAGAGGVGGAGG
ncbi:phosphoribosylglycinamide formyltransferase 2, partial [Mycobacterium avium subsp. hominissuis]